jgi:threonyl-tRNA synthetase
MAESALVQALEEMGREYKLNPGDGAFYGPKIDFHITDALGRSWQCGTCQLDFFMAERFELTYTAQDDTQRTPVMVHRALLGSIERFLGILIEHHAGEFPVWLAPVQARVLPIADRHGAYASRVADELRAAGVRAEVDGRSESVGRKIRDAELAKVPYMLVVGDKEEQQVGVSLRRHREGDIGLMALGAAADRIAGDRI